MRRSARITASSAAALLTVVVGLVTPVAGSAASSTPAAADAALDRAVQQLVNPGGLPGAVSIVQRGGQLTTHAAGVADVSTGSRPSIGDHIRLASVSKAFNGAVALGAVRDGALSLDDTIAKWLPRLPKAWRSVTLAEALHHTSGLPDFTGSPRLAAALAAAPFDPPPPAQLLSYVADQPLEFKPSSKYRYSNSDNVVAALMVEAATGDTYEHQLQAKVTVPLGLSDTTLPRGATIPPPFVHGYTLDPPSPPQDGSENVFAMGWAYASGGMVSTPADLNRFIRAYAAGATGTRAAVTRQFRFVAGSSDPPGPGTNSAGLALFRYETRCGAVYGHTGNIPGGYTQFAAATRDGTRSATVSVSAAITPKSDPRRFSALRRVYELAVCAALAR